MKTALLFFRNAQLFIAVLLAATASCPTRAQENAASPITIPTISMTSAQLPTAIDILARQAQLNFILDSHLANNSQTVSFTWTNLTARQALDRLLKEHDLDLIESPATTVARITPRNLHIKPVDPALIGHDTNAAVVPIISMSYAPLDQAIQMLADQAKLKIVLDEGSLSSQAGQPAPVVSFRWENLTARQALVALLDCYDLTLIESPDTAIIHIKPKAKS